LVTFLDTNIVIDVLRRDATWFAWSSSQLAGCIERGDVVVSAIAVAELSWGFDAFDDLVTKLDGLSLTIQTLSAAAAFEGGKRFHQYRRTRRDVDHPRVLPDFLIGAQALSQDAVLLTRDPKLYRRYFPDLSLITPETHP
jgi:predicted nucleic acid-binding protein